MQVVIVDLRVQLHTMEVHLVHKEILVWLSVINIHTYCELPGPFFFSGLQAGMLLCSYTESC